MTTAIQWLDDLDQGQQQAKSSQKILFVDFYKTPG